VNELNEPFDQGKSVERRRRKAAKLTPRILRSCWLGCQRQEALWQRAWSSSTLP